MHTQTVSTKELSAIIIALAKGAKKNPEYIIWNLRLYAPQQTLITLTNKLLNTK